MGILRTGIYSARVYMVKGLFAAYVPLPCARGNYLRTAATKKERSSIADLSLCNSFQMLTIG